MNRAIRAQQRRMQTIQLTVSPPTQQGYPNNPWMVRLKFGEARPEHRTLVRDNILKPWCHDNCAGDWWITKTKYADFRNETDAVMFYLRFR
jgi:hypothetical protein